QASRLFGTSRVCRNRSVRAKSWGRVGTVEKGISDYASVANEKGILCEAGRRNGMVGLLRIGRGGAKSQSTRGDRQKYEGSIVCADVSLDQATDVCSRPKHWGAINLVVIETDMT